MSDILLAQPILPEGFIDCSVGEPHIIRDTLLNILNIESCMPDVTWKDFVYPSPCGNPELVSYLEKKHGAPVVITNGAKQALGASFYALNKMKKPFLGMKNPYWALIPPLANLHDVHIKTSDPYRYDNFDSYLLLAPNNPDGSLDNLDHVSEHMKRYSKPFIHDGAYYTHNYIDSNQELKTYGDVQIFSMSKTLGLSSLRLGYAVCQNEEMYKHIQYYMEHMTVGVSNLSQMFLMNIFNKLHFKLNDFENECFLSLKENKKLVKGINPKILEVPDNIEDIPGMFLWAKCNDYEAFKKAKLYIINGEPFGNKDYVRINLGFTTNVMKDIVERINSI